MDKLPQSHNRVKVNFTGQVFGQIASNNPKTARVTQREAELVVHMEALRARMTMEELGSLQREIFSAIREIGCYTAGALGGVQNFLRHVNPSRKPFDLSASVDHFADQDETLMQTTPANLVQLYKGIFCSDPRTQYLIDYLTKTAHDPSETSIFLEIPGAYPQESFDAIDEIILHYNRAENMSCSLQEPDIGRALQSAIQRSHSDKDRLRSYTVTNHPGPTAGKKIVVFSQSGSVIVLGEAGENEIQYPLPTTRYLVRDLNLS